MTLSRLAVQFLVAVAALCGVNGAIAHLAENSIPRQTLRRGEAARPATDLFFGDSTVAAGIDEAAFAAAKPGRSVNLGLGATGPAEHFLLLHRQTIDSKSTVYYGFHDMQLTDPVEGEWATLHGNRALSYYVDPEIAIGFYAPDQPLQAWTHRIVGHVPMLVERSTLWGKVEVARRRLAELGMPKQKVNRFGRADDFALLEAEPDEMARRCRSAVEDRASLAAPIAKMIDHVGKQGAKSVFIEMPMPTRHRKLFYSGHDWSDYRNRLEQLTREAGAAYVDASDWIDDSEFIDNLHLSPSGAERFSRRLAEWTVEHEPPTPRSP